MFSSNTPIGYKEDEGNELSNEESERAFDDFIDNIDNMISEGIV